MLRFLVALAACSIPAFGWTESVEFPWKTFPRHLWERELVWMKNIGVKHVSLPPGERAQVDEAIAIVRRLGLKADLEGPVPPEYEALSSRHGGPLTDAPEKAQRLSVLQPDALLKAREMLLAGAPGLIWTNVEDTLGASGYVAGAVTFGGQERPAASVLRRSAQLSAYWSAMPGPMLELPGAGTRLPAEAITVKQYTAGSGMSLVAVVNTSTRPWTGDIKATYPALHRLIVLPGVTVGAKDAAWLPIGIPLTSSALCRDCNGFSPLDHLVYATSELTAMEYENGILALEFAAPDKGEVVLQLSREPSGPLVAAGKPVGFDWDDKTLRARLPVPPGNAGTHHVRIGIAMDAPDSTAFFDSARALLIGETNRLKAEFSSGAVAQRSRLLISPAFPATQKSNEAQPLEAHYEVSVPTSAVHGDHADLTLEADGSRLSHQRPQLLKPVTLRFTDGVSVRVGTNSNLALYPAVIPFNAKAGRDFGVTVRNNANEIRTFRVSVSAPGLEFSPTQTVTVGASDSREVVFRVFPAPNSNGLTTGEARVTGAASATEPLRLLALPQTGALAWSADGFSFLESGKLRAAFFGERWLEYLNKESGNELLPVGGTPFTRPMPSAFPDLDALLPAAPAAKNTRRER